MTFSHLTAEELRADEAFAARADEDAHRVDTHADCYVCGGDGWLPSLPEGASDCPACRGSGRR